MSPTLVRTLNTSSTPALKSDRCNGRIVYFSGRAEVTVGEMRVGENRGPSVEDMMSSPSSPLVILNCVSARLILMFSKDVGADS